MSLQKSNTNRPQWNLYHGINQHNGYDQNRNHYPKQRSTICNLCNSRTDTIKIGQEINEVKDILNCNKHT